MPRRGLAQIIITALIILAMILSCIFLYRFFYPSRLERDIRVGPEQKSELEGPEPRLPGLEVETESGRVVEDASWPSTLDGPLEVAVTFVEMPEPGEAILIGSAPSGYSGVELYYFCEDEQSYLLCNAEASRLSWYGGESASEVVILGDDLFSCFLVSEEILESVEVTLYP
jgi:hypothetical protein